MAPLHPCPADLRRAGNPRQNEEKRTAEGRRELRGAAGTAAAGLAARPRRGQPRQPQIPARPGEIVIVNHGGRGWWDPLSEAKGDVFTLVQYLDPSLTFAGACRVLRGFAGITPASAGPPRPADSGGRMSRLNSAGSGARSCHTAQRSGATSLGSADCQKLS